MQLTNRLPDSVTDQLPDRSIRLPSGRAGLALLGVVLVGTAAAPYVVDTFTLYLLTRMLILAVFAVSFNILFGFANLPGFGHAAFYGLGAYGFAIGLEHTSLGPAILAGILAAMVYAVVVAFFSTRGRGIYFALLTFAFAQILYEVFRRLSDITGGTNGLIVGSLTLPGGYSTGDEFVMFYMALGLLCVVLALGHRLLGSPFGKVLQAIRNNPERARAIGYPVRRVQIVVFVISAALASLSGILYVMTNRFVSPTVLNYHISIEVLIVTIIGGPQSLLGPALGAVFLVAIEDMVRGFAEYSTMMVGAVFIFVVMFVPEGIYGRLKE